MSVPVYPDFSPLELSMREDLIPVLRSARSGGVADGVSEFTFAGLYLFREQYGYQVAMLPSGEPVVTGSYNEAPFFLLPLGLPDDSGLLQGLFEHSYLKNLSQSDVERAQQTLSPSGYVITEDRDNADYLYLTSDLADLPGKRFHKKRNHVNAFRSHYQHVERAIDRETVADAQQVLETWREGRDDIADYRASREALELYRELGLSGMVVYVDNHPVAYTLGEPLPAGDSFVIHCEKAIDGYRGAYQYVNSAFAATLVDRFRYINREQDLGNPGLRQAKMTYRPAAFVNKYRVTAPVSRKQAPALKERASCTG